jgi:hypothetical protein
MCDVDSAAEVFINTTDFHHRTASRSVPMRRASLSVLLLLVGCGNGFGPANELSGTWAAIYPFPGSSLVLNLRQEGAGITGTGTYVQEAGRAGTLQVVGTYHRPSINLSLHYDFSQDPAYYVGTVQDGSHITGALQSLSVPLVRQ